MKAIQYLADLVRTQNLQDKSNQSSTDTCKMTAMSDIEAEIGQNLSVSQNRKKQRNVVGCSNIAKLISERNIFGSYEETVKRRILSNFLPSNPCRVAQFCHKVFCGRYCGQEGEQFMTASQDCRIRIYNTARGQFSCEQTIQVRLVTTHSTPTDWCLSGPRCWLVCAGRGCQSCWRQAGLLLLV